LFNISSYKEWFYEEFSQDIIISGLKSIKDVHQRMILPEKQNIATDNSDPVSP
jgi:hypothetical protein